MLCGWSSKRQTVTIATTRNSSRRVLRPVVSRFRADAGEDEAAGVGCVGHVVWRAPALKPPSSGAGPGHRRGVRAHSLSPRTRRSNA